MATHTIDNSKNLHMGNGATSARGLRKVSQTDSSAKTLHVNLSSYDWLANCNTMFIEYYDVLDARWFVFLNLMSKSNVLCNIFDTTIFADMGPSDLYEWYINREHFNMFYDIPLIRDFPTKEERDEFLSFVQYDSMVVDELFDADVRLNMLNVICSVMETTPNMIKHLVIYEGNKRNRGIEFRLKKEIPHSEDIEFVYGELDDALEDIDKDTTYVFSDVTKVFTLERLDRINLSSVLLADGYRFNFTKDGTPIVDAEEYQMKYTCRMNYFNNLDPNPDK